MVAIIPKLSGGRRRAWCGRTMGRAIIISTACGPRGPSWVLEVAKGRRRGPFCAPIIIYYDYRAMNMKGGVSGTPRRVSVMMCHAGGRIVGDCRPVSAAAAAGGARAAAVGPSVRTWISM